MVPTFRWVFVRSNFFFASVSSYLTSRPLAAAHSLRKIARHFRVMTELHRIRRPPRSHRPKFGSVTEHLSQGHVRLHVLRGAASLHAEDVAAARREVAHHVTEVLLRHHDVDLHDRLQQVRLCLLHPILDSHRTGDLKRHFARVDGVLRPIDERDGDVDHGISRGDATLQRFTDALFDRRDVLARDASLRDLVHEDETASSFAGLHVDLGMAELALATSLADEPADAMSRALDGLLVGDLRLALVRVNAKLAEQAVDDDLEVQLAHALDDRLARLIVGVHPEGRVLFRKSLQRHAELFLVDLRLRLDRN